MSKFTIDNGEARHAQHPATFEIPSLEERQSVLVGHFAKLIFVPEGKDPDRGTERMWCEVTNVNNDGSYRGTIANYPVMIRAKFGDPVAFKSKHIINIQKLAPHRSHGKQRRPRATGWKASGARQQTVERYQVRII